MKGLIEVTDPQVIRVNGSISISNSGYDQHTHCILRPDMISTTEVKRELYKKLMNYIFDYVNDSKGKMDDYFIVFSETCINHDNTKEINVYAYLFDNCMGTRPEYLFTAKNDEVDRWFEDATKRNKR